MGRKSGSTMRCTCRTCGAIEFRRGCNNRFQCTSCRPRPFTLKQAAHSAVAVAVRRGDLPRARDCQCADCGGPAIEYEHRDYTKPLDVVPICRRCNLLRGPAIGSTAMKRTTVYIQSATGITHGEFLACAFPE